MRDRRPRAGSALIEVVLALVVLAISGSALVTLLGQTMFSVQSLGRSERETRQASAELNALAVLDRTQLISRVGRTVSRDGWSFVIDRVTPDLFDVSVSASDTSVVLLWTTLYRADSTNVEPP